ncbi:MAG: ATP-binding protein [Bacilli bacterium]
MSYLDLLLPSALIFLKNICSIPIFTYGIGRKNNFLPKCIVLLSALLFVTFFLPFLYSLFENAANYNLLLINSILSIFISGLALYWLFDIPYEFAIFCETIFGLASFLSKQVSYTIILAVSTSFSQIDFSYEILIELASFIVIGFFIYYFFFTRFKNRNEKAGSKLMIVFSAIFVVVSLSMEGMSLYLKENQTSYFLMITLCETLYALIIAIIYYSFLNQGESEAEIAIIRHSWEEDRRHYEMQKESVEMIGIKIHDLKHQINDIRQQGNLTDKMARQLEESADIYQSVVQTGNNVLDVILSSISLRCQKNSIQLTCMVDGKSLSFMDDVDIYSLFGNMMDNAFEYETKVKNINSCFISLTVKSKDGYIQIHEENHFHGTNTSKDVTKTTKKDKENHGFGTKSMAKIAERYKGSLYFKIEDKMYQVDCIIPIPKEAKL